MGWRQSLAHLFAAAYTAPPSDGDLAGDGLRRRKGGAGMADAGIMVKLDGGLGNQMFQYALGRSLSLHLGVPLVLDISAYRSYTTRQYTLGVFNISAAAMPTPSSSDAVPVRLKAVARGTARLIKGLLPPAIAGLRRKVALGNQSASVPSWAPPGPWTIYRERGDITFDAALFACQPPIYLAGFWHNERYFADCADTIRRDFTLKVALSEKARLFQKQIAEMQPSVSLHVRRGDYVRNTPEVRQRLDVCGVDYYRRALALISSKIPEARVFVFSDEIGWAKENLGVKNAVYVECCLDYEELFLMSCCHHHIIANSTFSWWGAWLNASDGKMVVAPKQWINGDTSGSTLVLDGWYKL